MLASVAHSEIYEKKSFGEWTIYYHKQKYLHSVKAETIGSCGVKLTFLIDEMGPAIVMEFSFKDFNKAKRIQLNGEIATDKAFFPNLKFKGKIDEYSGYLLCDNFDKKIISSFCKDNKATIFLKIDEKNVFTCEYSLSGFSKAIEYWIYLYKKYF